jgi:hypothetical protein
LRIRIVPPEGPVALGAIAGFLMVAGQVKILPAQRQLRFEAERAPVIDPRGRFTLGDLALTVDAQGALLPIHLGSQLALLEPVELRAGVGDLIRRLRKFVEVRFLGFP